MISNAESRIENILWRSANKTSVHIEKLDKENKFGVKINDLISHSLLLWLKC